MAHFLQFLALFLGCILLALWRGGWAERAAAVILAVNFIATPFVPQHATLKYAGFEPATAALDVAALLALAAVALRSEKFWPLWMTAFQATATASHIGPYLGATINAFTYKAAIESWSYPQLILLAAATVWHDTSLRGAVVRRWQRS